MRKGVYISSDILNYNYLFELVIKTNIAQLKSMN